VIRRVLIGSRYLAVSTGAVLAARCAECHDRTYVSLAYASLPSAERILICGDCAAQLFVGEIHATTRADPSAPVVVDYELMPERARFRDLLRYLPTFGWLAPNVQQSPIWVKCPRCAAYLGDRCRGDRGRWFCQARVEENLCRLEDLETWAIRTQTSCCRQNVLLCWRTVSVEVEISGVPCTCGKTYAMRVVPSDVKDERIKVDRMNPHLVEMACWGAE